MLHGGTMEVRSEGLGRGSEFIDTLPLLHAEPAGDEQDLTPCSTSGKRPAQPVRILIADDNHDTADACATLLELDNHEVRVAYSGVQALQMAAEFKPHLALLDIGMPGMNGYEVERNMRAAEYGRHMLLVAISGWGQESDKRQAKEAGFDEHRAKPVDFNSLGGLIARCASKAG